ncbi:MAG: 3-hydroxyacyl-CoA dehydrogenase NAD-binding domain-containing protein [Rhodospirillales bacterium]|nr:3-hydroxyacyl-CoA dehydrogenase NAD-binding domain-containing protein [Rhodospirillales bacterium]
MAELVDYEKRGTVGVVFLDNPPVNAMGAAVRQGVVKCLTQACDDPDIQAVVLVGRGRCFSGGADIREFGKPFESPHLREVIDTAENSPKPVVAAIHGTAVGGGLELALGCHYRVGDKSARLGLPEIKLGLLPGAGGTQRLPRLIGVEPALGIVLSGEYMPADKALALGLLDEVAEGGLAEGAVTFAERLVSEGRPLRKTRELTIDPEGAAGIFEKTRKSIARKARGLIAPYRCIESVENAVALPYDEGMAKEREYFLECLESEQSKGQRHAFFAERQATKIPDVPADTPVQPIETAAVLGCGTMGGGIAMNFANAGIPVTVLEAEAEALDKGLAIIAKNYTGSVSRGRITQEQMDRRLALITGTTDYADIAEADIVIEAVFEDMDLKKRVYATLDETCKPAAILATNTSTLDVDEIAAATKRPGKVIGTHFFSPANVMKLMENVRGAKTSDETIATVMKLSKTIGKVGVLVGVCDGFVGNRMLYAYTRQAAFLLEEGALPHQVDKVIYDFGFPMGPFAMGDLAGLDVGWRIRQRRAKTRPKDERYSPIADRICERGRFGQKTNAGWYRYEEGSRTPQPDPEIEELIVQVSGELGFERREISEQEILERCMYPLINEGAKILEEGIAIRASDVDVVWIYGYGFPVHRGGPMFYADRVGAKAIHETMSRLHDQHGEMLRPAPLLADLAKSGKGFGDL